jgi:hypothetical protein
MSAERGKAGLSSLVNALICQAGDYTRLPWRQMILSAKVVNTALAIMVGNESRVLGSYDVYKGPANFDPALASGPQFPIHDSLYPVLAMAAVISNLDLISRRVRSIIFRMHLLDACPLLIIWRKHALRGRS